MIENPRNPLAEYIKAKDDYRNPLPHETLNKLDRKISQNIFSILKNKVQSLFVPDSVDRLRQTALLKMRHQVLMSFRFPVVVEMASDETDQKTVDSNINLATEIRKAKTSNLGKELTIINQPEYNQGTIYVSNPHEFPLLQQEIKKAAADVGLKFPSISESQTALKDFNHEMGHLLAIFESEHVAKPLVGYKIFVAYKNGNYLGWGLGPIATYDGELTLDELRWFKRGDESDTAENDRISGMLLENI